MRKDSSEDRERVGEKMKVWKGERERGEKKA